MKLVATPISVPVKYWDDYHPSHAGPLLHQIDIDDQREAQGQLFIDIGASEGHVDDFMGITVEVNKNPLSRDEHVPCVHVHFSGSSLAFSVTKVGEKLVLRPEVGVTFTPHDVCIEGVDERLLIVEDNQP